MAKITINGVTIETSGKSIVVSNGKVIVDGNEIQVGEIKNNRIDVHVLSGEVGSLKADGNIYAQDVKGDVDAGGSVDCKNVGGSVDAGGSISCGDVSGSVDAGGSVRCGRVGGDVDAGGSVHHG